jgi:hypothetical protein
MGRRSGAWIKVKHRQRRELVIGGWVEGEGRRRGLPGGLLLGYCDGDRFIYAGRCGTGLHARDAAQAGGDDAAARTCDLEGLREDKDPRAVRREGVDDSTATSQKLGV